MVSSFSRSSSRSASPEPSDTMQIFIQPISGTIFPLTVPSNLSISHLMTLLSVRTALPENALRLVYAGKHLATPASSLADYSIGNEATVMMALPMRGGMPPKKIRCTFKECREGAQRIIGDCGFCQGHYCGKHRLLEDHKCDGLEDCKKESHDRNAAQLNSERTQVIKGI
ncbi:putative polyubiquitin [Calycina marina]|uniref:Polyubiquitin n=1 Tax=Calycina marina TaxID=1763456 RepID=A0A9P8CEL6_9HELO|nr:putative polyubiquitin [Calycina marina]